MDKELSERNEYTFTKREYPRWMRYDDMVEDISTITQMGVDIYGANNFTIKAVWDIDKMSWVIVIQKKTDYDAYCDYDNDYCLAYNAETNEVFKIWKENDDCEYIEVPRSEWYKVKKDLGKKWKDDWHY